MAVVSIKRRNLDTDKGECHVKVKTEIRVMILQVEECHRVPGHHWELSKRHGTDSLSQPSDGTHPTETLILKFQLPELRDNSFLLFKSLSLQYIVIAALAN